MVASEKVAESCSQKARRVDSLCPVAGFRVKETGERHKDE